MLNIFNRTSSRQKNLTKKQNGRFGRMSQTGRFGVVIIFIYILVALGAPLIAPHSPVKIFPDALSAWSWAYPLGTDQLGRDVLSRLIYGMRTSLAIAVMTTMIAFLIGGGLGIFAALRGGWVDQLLSRLVDILMAIPALIFALMLLSIFGTSVANLIIIIAILDCTRVFRILRAVAANIVATDYVTVARLRGEHWFWIMRKEILPNIVPTIAAEFGIRFCYVFLTIAALSFLGIGVQPPAPDLGSMVRESAGMLAYATYNFQLALLPLIPALVIALLTISVNLVTDVFLQTSRLTQHER